MLAKKFDEIVLGQAVLETGPLSGNLASRDFFHLIYSVEKWTSLGGRNGLWLVLGRDEDSHYTIVFFVHTSPNF